MMEKVDAYRHDRAVRAVLENWYGAMENGDVAGLISLVTPDVIVKPPGAPPIEGSSALEQALNAFLEAYTESIDYEVPEIEISGQLAFARILETTKIRPRSGTDVSLVNGMHLTILRRQPDGQWLIARDISSLIEAA